MCIKHCWKKIIKVQTNLPCFQVHSNIVFVSLIPQPLLPAQQMFPSKSKGMRSFFFLFWLRENCGEPENPTVDWRVERISFSSQLPFAGLRSPNPKRPWERGTEWVSNFWPREEWRERPTLSHSPPSSHRSRGKITSCTQFYPPNMGLDGVFSLEDPTVKAYVFYGSILVAKTGLMSFWTARHRLPNRVGLLVDQICWIARVVRPCVQTWRF